MPRHRFPRTEVYLERTKLGYVDLSAILTDAKRDRSARVSGVVAVEVGELFFWIFMRRGEAVTALRRRWSEGGELVSIPDAVRFASQEAERGRILYYGVPESQLRAMFAVSGEPLAGAGGDPGAGTGERSELRSGFRELLEGRRPAVVEIRSPEGQSYVRIGDGAVEEAYLLAPDHGGDLFFLAGEGIGAGTLDPEGPGDNHLSFAPAPVEVDRAGARERVEELLAAGSGIRAYPPVEGLPRQAAAALAALYRVLLERTLERVGKEVGMEAAREALARGRERAAEQHPGITAFRIAGERIEGEPVVEDAELTAAVVSWLLRTLEVAEGAGLDSSAEVVEEVTREYRHALKEAGFLSRLPWPLPI